MLITQLLSEFHVLQWDYFLGVSLSQNYKDIK